MSVTLSRESIWKRLVSGSNTDELELFSENKRPIFAEDEHVFGTIAIKRITGEFWTSRQRQAASLHEVSYRACFKPQLPQYFIQRFTSEGDVVYDPFSGRGTTAIEAALNGRKVIANDVNPLSAILASPRLNPPTLKEISDRLSSIELNHTSESNIDLSMFYHPKTESEIVSLKQYLMSKSAKKEDHIDSWIRMVATNRLTGHSSGFFSVYTFPPNQAVSQESQKKINIKRNQVPEYRDTRKIILKKSKQLLSDLSANDIETLRKCSRNAIFLTEDARRTFQIEDGSVSLTVTSPPFLDIVQYADDNWLRCWFNNISLVDVERNISIAKTLKSWSEIMDKVFYELHRITKRGGFVAFEVGEVRNGKIKLEEHVVPLGLQNKFSCEAVLINAQSFTKTSNIWGVSNNANGTNSNRIVLFKKL